MGKTFTAKVMKVLFITSKITDSGGVSSILCQKANALCSQEDTIVAVASTNDEHTQPFFALDKKIPLYLLQSKMKHPFSLLKFKSELKRVIKTFQPDVISVADNGLKSLFVKKMFPTIPIIYEIHTNESLFYNANTKGLKAYLHRILSKRYLPLYDAIVTLNPTFTLPQKVKKAVYIPNFVDKKPPSTPQYNTDKIIAVGRIVKEKNYNTLLRIWKKVSKHYPNKKLHIYGSWEDISIVEKIQSTPQVVLHQPEKDKNKIYSDAYLLLHTATNEGFPMIFLESMSHGVPIVCFDINQPHLVLDNTTGSVASSGDEKDFVKKVESLLNSETQRNIYSRQALKQVEKFQTENVLVQWHNLYRLFCK